MKVGYVGFDKAGDALSRLRAAHEVQVACIGRDGDTSSARLPALARDSEVVIIDSGASSVVRSVVLGEAGLVQGLAAGKILLDQTVGDPVETRAMATEVEARGAYLVDAPLSGLPGSSCLLWGGPAGVSECLQPVFAALASNQIHCGGVGNGQLARILDDMVAACNCLITYEAVTMGFKYGLPLRDMSDVLTKSTGRSGMSERLLPALAAGGGGDMEIGPLIHALNVGTTLGVACGAPMLIPNTARGLLQMMNTMHGTPTLDALTTAIGSLAGTRFHTAPGA